MKIIARPALMAQPRIRARAGFSLTEVVLSVGVVAFALTSLTGLMVVGLDSNKNSTDETRSIYIAQQLFSDLRGSEGAKANTPNAQRKLIAKVASTLNTTKPELRDLDGDGKTTIGDVDLAAPNAPAFYVVMDENGDALGALTADEYKLGKDLGLYAAKVEFSDAMMGTVPQTGVKRVKVTVASPARAKDDNREHFIYESLVSTL
jgi:type II secretory pathway pseudopilin PulG